MPTKSTQAATGPRWISQQQAAEHMGVSEKTVRNMIASGQLRGYRIGTRTIRLKAEDVDALFRPIPAVGA